MASSPPSPAGAPRGATTFALVVWAVGVQWNEGLAAVGLVATVALVVWSARGRSLRLGRWTPLLAFVGWSLLVPVLAGRWPSSAGLARTLEWLALPAGAAALATLDARGRRVLVAAVLGALALSCLAAALQHFGRWPAPSSFAAWRWTRIPFDRMAEPLPGRTDRFMAGGLLFHRLKFAHVSGLAVLWLLALGVPPAGPGRRECLAAAAAGFLAVGWLPHARAAAGALLVAGMAVLAMRLGLRRAAPVVAAVALSAVALVALTPSLRMRFLSSASDEGNGDRRLLVASGLLAVREHPLAGVGLGRFRPGLYPVPGMPAEVASAGLKSHDQWVTLAAEAGIPAALLFTWLLVALWRRMDAATGRGAAGRGCLAFLALLCTVHDPLFHASMSMAVVLALGTALPRDAQ